jgi:hypothetical protein
MNFIIVIHFSSIVKTPSIIYFFTHYKYHHNLVLSLQGKLRQKQGSEPKASLKHMVKMKQLLTQKRMHKNQREAFPILVIRNPKSNINAIIVTSGCP